MANTRTITIGVPVEIFVDYSTAEIEQLLITRFNKFIEGSYKLPENDGNKKVNVTLRLNNDIIDLIKENVKLYNLSIIVFTYLLLRG